MEFESKGEEDVEYLVSVSFLQGKNLTSRDKVGQGDPYCVVIVQDGSKKIEKKTKAKRNTHSPVWNEKVEIPTQRKPSSMIIRCMDKDRLKKDDLIGQTTVDLHDKWDQCGVFSWEEIHTKNKRDGKLKHEGRIQVQIQCQTVQKKRYFNNDDFTHLLGLHVVSGRQIKQTDFVGKSEVYVIVNWGIEEHETKTVGSSGSPEWDETMYLFVDQEVHNQYKIKITVVDKDPNKDDRIGEGYIDAAKIFEEGRFDGWVDLHKKAVDSDKKLTSLMKEPDKGRQQSVGQVHIVAKLTTREILVQRVYKAILNEFDDDHDGLLDRNEVIALFTSIGGQLGEADNAQRLDEWFQTVDENKDGKISQDELEKFMKTENFQSSDHMKTIIHSTVAGDVGASTSALMKGVMYPCSMEDATIAVKERSTGLVVKENIPTYVVSALKIMFGNVVSRHLSSRTRSRNIMQTLSERQGKKFDAPASKPQIQSFIDLHNLDTTEIEKDKSEYENFNEFFARKLKPDVRPICAPDDSSICVSPADCRMMVFPNILDATDIWIKGSNFTLENLFGEKYFREKSAVKANVLAELGREYLGGSMAIARLSPQDYHRWHVPVTGTHGKITRIPGALYTVNPIAIGKDVDVYTENKRAIVEIESVDFGKVVMVVVGATMVGSYFFEGREEKDDELFGKNLQKGDIHGQFRFGGSTVIVLFQKDRIEFDEDLVQNSNHPIETLLKVNTRIGRALYPKGD